MKICFQCGDKNVNLELICAACGAQPNFINGFPSFLPNGAPEEGCGFESKFFEQLSEAESDNFWFISRNQLLIWCLKKYFPLAKNFFEIGCGTGFVLSAIEKNISAIHHLYGSDMYTDGLAFAASRLKSASFFQMDARNIPARNEYDVIGIFDVLEHIEEDEMVLTQIHQALKPGGGLIITVPHHQFLWSEQDVYSHHVRRYSTKELETKVTNAGFKVIRKTSFVSLLLPLMLYSRLKVKNKTYTEADTHKELKLPPFINSLLKKIMQFEIAFIKYGLNFPFGGSLLLIAHKE